MTPFESSLYVALVAPVLALCVSVFFKKGITARWNPILLALSGIGGTVAAAYGAVAETPFTMVLPMFYGMTIALDRFSAIFFLGISIVVAAAGMFAMAYNTKHQNDAPRLRKMGIAAAILVIGAQWVMLAGNIIGFIAAWEVMMLAVFFLILNHQTDQKSSVALNFFSGALLCSTAVTAGFFILSSGALFSDFGTLAYLAGQADPQILAIGYGLLLFGFAATVAIAPFHRWFSNTISAVPSHIGALIRASFSGVAFYGFIRCILFILPPLSLWYTLPLFIVGALSMFIGAFKSHGEVDVKRIISAMSLQNFGVVFLMLGGAMALQALTQYDAMNVMLFAAFIQMTVSTIATSGLLFVRNVISKDSETISDLGGLAKRMPKLTAATAILLAAAVGLPPFASFTSAWMFATTLGTVFHALETPYAVTAIVILVLFVLSMIIAISAALRFFMAVFLGTSRSSSDETVSEPSDAALTPIVILALLTLLSGFALPQLLVMMGADPLTSDAGTFMGGVVTAAGTLRMSIIGLVILAIIIVKWYFRSKWIHRVPSFEAIEACRIRCVAKCKVGDRFKIGSKCKDLCTRALQKFHR